jgi:hypothetical protein
MRKIKSCSFLLVILILFNFSCKKESGSQARLKPALSVQTEIDAQEIANLTGVRLRILKSESIGISPRHKFFWVCLAEKAEKEKVEGLAMEIIKKTIALNPKTYHSFIIHFFCEKELTGTPEESKPYARATFLPYGTPDKVGRIPINNYQDYILTCTFLSRKDLP